MKGGASVKRIGDSDMSGEVLRLLCGNKERRTLLEKEEEEEDQEEDQNGSSEENIFNKIGNFRDKKKMPTNSTFCIRIKRSSE